MAWENLREEIEGHFRILEGCLNLNEMRDYGLWVTQDKNQYSAEYRKTPQGKAARLRYRSQPEVRAKLAAQERARHHKNKHDPKKVKALQAKRRRANEKRKEALALYNALVEERRAKRKARTALRVRDVALENHAVDRAL